MWQPTTYEPQERSLISSLYDLKGDLTLEQSQIALAKYLYANPFFALKLLTNVEILPVQELAIRMMVKKDSSMFVWGRGVSKTFITALFICFYCVFNPDTRIVIAASNFRQTKEIYKYIEKIKDSKNGILLNQCIKRALKSPEAWTIEFLNGSEVRFLPLGQGDQIRGARAHVLIVDEFLLMNENIFSSVIRPFLAAKRDGIKEHDVRAAEEKLIKAGRMTEEERTVFPSNKLIVLSSASFKFQYLYHLYQVYVDTINKANKDKIWSDTGIMKLSYEAMPERSHIDFKNINKAKKESSSRLFDMEYRAHFIDESGGFFDLSKMEECSVPPGEHPTVKIKGDPKKKYILAADPNYSDSETSDNFSMILIELDEKDPSSGTLVHPYAVARSNITKRGDYVKYLFDNFNIVFVIADKAGGKKFFDDLRTLGLLNRAVMECEVDFENDDTIRKTMKTYNHELNSILYLQKFQEHLWIRTANEHLAFCIQNKKIKFAAPVFHDKDMHKMMNQQIPIQKLHFGQDKYSENLDDYALKNLKSDFIDNLGALVEQTKKETALIETSTSSTGNVTFVIPSNLRGSESDPMRPRKDLYTSLVLGCWGMKLYSEILRIKGAEGNKPKFLPYFVA